MDFAMSCVSFMSVEFMRKTDVNKD